MSCSQTLAGIARDCSPSMGGLKRILIANYADVSEITADEQVTAITMNLEAKFKEYAFRTGVASMTSTLNKDAANGVSFVTTDVLIQFNKMETAKRVEMSALSVNDLVVIVEDNNGKYWYLGKDEPVTASAGDGASGAARTDANKYGITLQDNSLDWPLEVEASIIPDLIG